MAFMPWNWLPVKFVYRSLHKAFLHNINNRTNIRPLHLANEIRRLTAATHYESADFPPNRRPSTENISEYQISTLKSCAPLPTFGFVSQWLSESGSPSDLDPLLRHPANPSTHHGMKAVFIMRKRTPRGRNMMR
ncbi:MAG: hypothetical protein L6R38_006978, partial [Xanthoria sp. 2 TBL-2021]